MRRFGVRLLMALVGLALLVCYLVTASLVVVLLTSVVSRDDLLAVATLVVLFTLVFGFLSYRFGTVQLLSSMEAVELDRQRGRGLYRRLDWLTARMDLDTPTVFVAEMQLPNAMALGTARRGAIVVDRSLFWLLSPAELEAILTHELAHLESHDGLVQTLAYSALRTVVGLVLVLVLPFVLLVSGIAQAGGWLSGRPASWTTSPLGRLRETLGRMVALLFVVLTLLVRAHSRRREFAADDRAADITGDPLSLARGLRRIERAAEPLWGLRSPRYLHGTEESRLGRLLSTHPPIDERVERLVERAEHERDEGTTIPVRREG